MVFVNKFTKLMAAMMLAFCGSAGAAGDGDGGWLEASSLRELPVGVQVLLRVGQTPDRDGIADRDGRFNPTAAVLEPSPRRRFALAAVGSNRVLVALELGGIGYTLRAVEFRLVGATWETERCAGLRSLPRRATELLAAWAARSAGPDAWACEQPYGPRAVKGA
jgi:hypothetical protein